MGQEAEFLGYSPEAADAMRRGLVAPFDWPTIDRLNRESGSDPAASDLPGIDGGRPGGVGGVAVVDGAE